MYLRPDEVFNRVAIDELYYLATGGGITFGGGEPLLYCDFIIDVLTLGADKWNITIETSLNIPFKQISILLPYINEIIVDIKDLNPRIYESYTQYNNNALLKNLKLLATNWSVNNVLLRIPLIKGYNTSRDVENSKKFLTSLGYSKFDIFEYKTGFRYDRKREMRNA
jgi:pyruvate formate lyase activating enzyme